ncbi:MAG: PfkB family carbohydrate kinase, partial [Beijerinckiaceae bacterium]
ARAGGAAIIANLAPVPAGLAPGDLDVLLAAIDILIVNEHEAEQAAALLGIPSGDSCEAVVAIARRSRRRVVATLGAAGAFSALPSGEVLRAAAPPIAPVDTTGAGDTFVGVLAASLAEGLDLSRAMERACKAASLACLALGAQAAMPRREAILS